jgi:hypothetical protein
MDERELTERLLTDHFNVASALVDMQLMRLSDDARSRVFDAVRNRAGHVELRTRIDTAKTELVLVPTDGTKPLWLARMGST